MPRTFLTYTNAPTTMQINIYELQYYYYCGDDV